MISVEEFLEGRHIPVAQLDYDDPRSQNGQAPRRLADATQDDERLEDTPQVRESTPGSQIESAGTHAETDGKRKRVKRPNRAHTHAVPVTSNYTSGFGGSLDTEDTGSGKRKYRRYGRGKSNNRYRRYRTGAPVKRVPDDPADGDACREAALTLLDATARSSGALIKRLIDKGYDPVVAEDVVTRLVEVHLIDDEEYARSVVRSCAGRMLGFRGTVMELKRKGVDDHMAQQVAVQAREQGVFEDAAWQLGRKVAAKTEGLELEVRRRRFWSAGGRKGHDPETLRRVAHELFDNVPETGKISLTECRER